MPSASTQNPPKIKILGEVWTLLRKNPPHPRYDGLCCYEDKKIYFAPSALRIRRLEIVAHELLHARFRELDEESVLAAGHLISRVVQKVRNSGARICDMVPRPSPAKAAKSRKSRKPQKASRKGSKK
jgi:hypothetical protein